MRMTWTPLLFFILVAAFALSFAQQSPKESTKLSGTYLGQPPPGDKAELFAPGVVSTGYFEHSSPVFTPDLKEIYWSTQIHDEDGRDTARPILFMKESNGVWSRPEIPQFSKAFPCSESPFISPGGKELFFHASQTLRPERTDLYHVRRIGDGWSEPVKLASPINALIMNVEPTVSANGTIYFVGEYRGNMGLYYSRLVDGRFQEPVAMEAEFNRLQADWTPYIAPDESYFIFCSFRPGGFGSGDLYISFRQKNGSWGRVVNMGDKVNTEANERFPNVTPDGKYFFFNSTRKIPGAATNAPGNGEGDVYWIDARIIEELRKTAAGRPLSDGGGQAVPVQPPAQAAADLAETVSRMLEEVAAKKVWPGFTSSTWPLALYDGEKTLLLWHPKPPAEFKPVPGRPGVLVCPGLYPDVRPGSTADIGGFRTATLFVTSGVGRATLIHETFHVFWAARHRVFRPDEMVRYGYPLTDVENLAGLLAESEALARALEADAPEQARRWAAAALEQRSLRRLRLDEESANFETDLEMLEGPASFVCDFAVGETSAGTALDLRRQNYAKVTGEWKRGLEEIRWRFYGTGEAMGWLLDRFLPGWKERLEADPNLSMQRLLETELGQKGGTQPAAFTAAEKAAFRADAEWAIADLARRQSDLRAELEKRGGARLIVETAPEAEPLQLGRFSPLDLFVLGNGEIVQANFITLSDSNGSVELKNPDYARRSFGGVVGLTESAGRHPLDDGTRRLTVFGLQGQPKVERKDGTVTIEAPGVRLTWKGAEVETEGATIKVKVGSGAGARRVQWTAKANLPLPHRNGKAVSSGGKIYYMGGYSPATKQDFEASNYEYDPQKDRWTAKSEIPFGRSNFAMASLGHKIFIIGGDPVLPNTDLYLTDEDRWEKLAPLSVPRQHIDCGMIGDKIYVVGGVIRDRTATGQRMMTPTVEIYDIAGNRWALGRPLPQARQGVQVAVAEGKLYAIGGGDDLQKGTISSAFERYDPEANAWESLPDLPYPILAPGIAVIGENIYVLGGSTPENGYQAASDKVCFYNVREKRWVMAGSLPKPTQFPAVAVIGDRIYVIGGCDKDFTAYDSVYEGIVGLPH